MKIKEIVVEGAFDNLKNLGKNVGQNFAAGATNMPVQAARGAKGRYQKPGTMGRLAHTTGKIAKNLDGSYTDKIAQTIKARTQNKFSGSLHTDDTFKTRKIDQAPDGYEIREPNYVWQKTQGRWVNPKGEFANSAQAKQLEIDYRKKEAKNSKIVAPSATPIDDNEPDQEIETQPQQKQPAQQAKPEKQPTIGGIGPDDPRYADLAAKMKNARPTPKQN